MEKQCRWVVVQIKPFPEERVFGHDVGVEMEAEAHSKASLDTLPALETIAAGAGEKHDSDRASDAAGP